ncbi:MAG: thioesterase family protein [Polyangiaceae bacterium]|nr:thioesterase family protein [Polyangiaceae bacterium]
MFPADLAADTAVSPIPKLPGQYLSKLPDHWNYINPCGGVLLTLALRAMTRELDGAGLSLLSATTAFCQPVLAGDVVIDVQILRKGDGAAQLRASMQNRGQLGPGLEVLATFARDKTGPDVHGATMPDVPRPDAAVATRSRTGPERWSFYKNFDVALGVGEPMWEPGWKQGPSHVAFWYRYRVPQRDAAGLLDPLAIPPIADSMPSALTRRLGPDHERFYMPSLDLSVFFIAPTSSDWLLVETFVERTRAGYAVGSATVWSEDGQLVARAAQAMTLRSLPRR